MSLNPHSPSGGGHKDQVSAQQIPIHSTNQNHAASARRPSLLRNPSSTNSIHNPLSHNHPHITNQQQTSSNPTPSALHSLHLKHHSSNSTNTLGSLPSSGNNSSSNSPKVVTPTSNFPHLSTQPSSSNVNSSSNNNLGNNPSGGNYALGSSQGNTGVVSNQQVSNANAGGNPGSASGQSNSTRSRSRSRSLTQTLSNNLHNNNQYLAQERAYLKKIKNQYVDDYYTKGITGADEEFKEGDSNANDDYDEEEDVLNAGNSDLLADIDDDKYQIDFSLAFSIMKNSNNININNRNISQVSRETSDDPAVIERLEWQSMLTSVLTGDVVRSEKTKIINNNNAEDGQESFIYSHLKKNIWFGVRAKLFNRTEDDQRKIVSYRRTLVDQLIEDVLKYEINYDDPIDNPPRKQVVDILDRYEKACELWMTMKEMRSDKPACGDAEFQDRIDALNAWLSITDAIARATNSLRVWIGNDELDITKSPVDSKLASPGSDEEIEGDESNRKVVKKIFDEDNKSLAERLMKEKDVLTIFKSRIFNPLAPWMVKSKDTYIRLGHIFEILKLPDYIHDLIQLCYIPMRLIKEIINVRLTYARKLHNPTLMMIDQMIDDFKSYITIALEVKLGVMEYCKPDATKTWVLSDPFDNETLDFDNVLLLCVRYFLVLLNRKLIDSSRSPTTFRTFKEPDELEDTWNYLKLLGSFVEGASIVVAENITLLTSKLVQRLFAYFNNQIRTTPPQSQGASDLIRWYTSTTENFAQIRRKLARFTGQLSRDFSNALVFDIPTSPGNRTKMLLENLRASNHFLVYTGTVETQGTYFFASPELLGNEHEIVKILNGSYVGIDSSGSSLEFSDLLKLVQLDEDKEEVVVSDEFPKPMEPSHLFNQARQSLPSNPGDLAYVIALCPAKPIVWEGEVVNVHIDEVPITDVKVGEMLVITKLPHYHLHFVRARFLEAIDEALLIGGRIPKIGQRCSLDRVHHELTKINRAFFKMSLAVLDSVKTVREKCKATAPEGGYQELINNYFVYARDYGKNTVKNLDSSRKSTVIMKLIQLSIEWVSFICDDCIPTDRRTFRYCVLALEFAMDMTRGFNVLVLSNDQFYRMKLKVARCMSLLISHFDIMGARSSEAEKRTLLKWTSQRHRIENSADDEYIIKAYQEDVMKALEQVEDSRRDLEEQLHAVGRVLDVTDSEYQFVTLLASSFSSVSIRWQKKSFVGGGSFGQVFLAINLDTGGLMAVKEIRFHDSQSIKIVPSIKDEMTILEMLNHPNVVQYYGVEVHRDKVYIFMEFCEGGSLSGLLAHGRIEDEMVIQIYTLQMLEGLAFLHHQGVIHRDIKPENILLDRNGVVKFVDFGAAKVIATSGKTRGSSSLSSSTRAIGNHNNVNSMTGTPMYMSPEVITGQYSDRNGVVDIWSLGCCVLEMATGRRPWANLDNEWAIMYHIAAGHQPELPSRDQLSEAGIKFLSKCLEHDPKKRSSAAELLNDPWIVQIRQVAFESEGGSTPSSEAGSELQ